MPGPSRKAAAWLPILVILVAMTSIQSGASLAKSLFPVVGAPGVTGATIAGTIVSLIGLVLVLNLTGAERVDPVGVLWGLGAAVGLAGYFFITAKANATLPPLVLATGGLVVGAVLMFLLGAARLLPMRATFGNVSFVGFATPWWAALLALVLVATVVAYVSGIMAARALGTKLASFVSLTEVLFAVLWAWLLLGEMPAGIQLLGGALIVGGVLLVRADELRSP